MPRPPRAFLPPLLHPQLGPARRPARFRCTQALPPPSPSSPPPPPEAAPSTLYLVATPIGHIHDLSPRARSILRTASVIAAEDTRVTTSLLRRLTSTAPPRPHHHRQQQQQQLLSLHAHNWRARLSPLLAHLSAGRSVALVSDAGTPCVSDPGWQLVRAAAAAGLRVVPVPGPCAALAALVAAGVPAEGFLFAGFLPRSGSDRSDAVSRVADARAAVILYEAPHRLLVTLDALADACEGRSICLAREVTKRFEQFLRFDSIPEAREWYAREDVAPRGEFTLVLGPPPVKQVERDDLSAYTAVEADVVRLTERLVEEGVPVSSIARCISAAVRVPKKLVYAHATRFKERLVERPAAAGEGKE